MKKDIEIAQEATIKPIIDIAATIGLQAEDLEQYGKYKSKIDWPAIKEIAERPTGKLILVTAINPTCGRRKVDSHDWIGRWLKPYWKTNRDCFTRTIIRSSHGDQGWCDWRRQSASLADGGHQSSFYRGHARNHCCE